MSKIKNTILTAATALLSITGTYAQNKADLKLSKELKTDPKYKMTQTVADNGQNVVNYEYFNSEDMSRETLTLQVNDSNNDGTAQLNEVTGFEYNFTGNSKWINVEGKVSADGSVEMYQHVESGPAEINRPLSASSLETTKYMTDVLSNLNKPAPQAPKPPKGLKR